MRRRDGSISMRAVIVESIGAMVILFLFFPVADRPLSSRTDSTTVASPARLPLLSLPTLPAAARLTAPELAQPELAQPDLAQPDRAKSAQQRHRFVTRELEYSRRALALMLDQHVQRLMEPFLEDE